jgi:LysM repeat protein
MVDPLPDMQKWGGKFATGSAGGDNRFTAPSGWRYVEKGEDPARYGSGPAAATSALPNLIYDPQSRTLKSADAPALDMSPKSKFKFDRTTQSQVPADGSGANRNIDNATRDRARAYAAKQNAPAAAKQKMDWKTIYALNKATIGANPNLIRPGMKLKMPDGSTYAVQSGDNLSKIAAKQSQINELSTEKLAQYKTAAARDARAADQEGDFKRGDRRFSGIVKATKKQFDNDAKQVDESRATRRALMARIVNSR